MNKRGFGGIYRRGRIYWIRYWYRGKAYYESSGSDSEAKATKLLKERIKQMGGGRFIGPNEERLTFDDLAEMLQTDYQINKRRSANVLGFRIAHLKEAFALVRAVDITTDRIRAFVSARQSAGASNATINRDLAALKRAFTLAVQAKRLAQTPHIPLLDEDNARQGFVERADFVALRQQLPDQLRDAVSFLYLTGWRLGEMKSLEWRDVDFGGGVVRLRPENSKNKDSRELHFSRFPELSDILTRAHARRRFDCPFVFHRAGKQTRQILRRLAQRLPRFRSRQNPRPRPPPYRRPQPDPRRYSRIHRHVRQRP
jgi:integrase